MAQTGDDSPAGQDVADFRDHIIIAGWSPTALRVLEGLSSVEASASRPIVLVNQIEAAGMVDVRERFPQLDIRHVSGSYHAESSLRQAGCARAAAAIVVADAAAGRHADSRTVLCALHIRNLGKARGVKICAELLDHEQEPSLRRAGVDEVIVRGEHNGYFLSSGALSPGIAKAARQLVTFGSGSELRRAPIPVTFRDRTIGELQEHVRESGALLLGILRESEVVTAAEVFGSGTDWIDAFIRASFEAGGVDTLDRNADPIKVFVNPPDDFVIEYKDSAILIGGARGG